MKDINGNVEKMLLQRLKVGEEAAFSEIYRLYWLKLYRFSRSILNEEQLAEDVVQDVFLALWNRREIVNIEHLDAYLWQAVRHAISKVFRSRKYDQQLNERLGQVTSDLIENHPTLFQENEQLLMLLIDGLPADCQTIFKLSREEQLTYAEIASKMGISTGTVAKKISQALAHIRTQLKVDLCLLIISWIYR